MSLAITQYIFACDTCELPDEYGMIRGGEAEWDLLDDMARRHDHADHLVTITVSEIKV